MKPKLTPIIGSDFIATNGDRITNFQLCTPENGRLAAFAVVDFRGDEIYRQASALGFQHRMPAIIRLASIYRKRSTPVSFR